MTTDTLTRSGDRTAILDSLLDLTGAAVTAVATLTESARLAVRAMVVVDDTLSADLLDEHQAATHGYAWLAACDEALRQTHGWAVRLSDSGRFGEMEALILQIAFGEYLGQVLGGLPMNQGEVARLHQMGLGAGDRDALQCPAVRTLVEGGNTPAARRRLVALMRDNGGFITFGNTGLDDELEMIRGQFRRFADDRIAPFAHDWHLNDSYIPLDLIEEMAALGVFGLTIPEEFGGLGLSKAAMCVVSEELSRGYIGVGSLGTRSEIAAELILGGGTEAQKAHWLPLIGAGEILPTAVFTEPGTGSDLASVRTRAVRDADGYAVTGNKTWITHAARADLMTMLVRTDPDSAGYRGLSMLLAEKTRGTEAEPFPSPGLSGSEIEVLGYRGMKEFELGFDGFRVDAENLLGGVEGQGFKQLMQTFESARIQTAARAIGVAQNALEVGLNYARERVQFGKSLIDFPRVADKLAMMAVEIMVTRQLTYFSARQKDRDRRCDVEAGMAKLLAARVAWAAADNALQIHGGNGFALEYQISRILCDARILNIFEGAGEIQAQVIARRLLATEAPARAVPG
ncbi:acyl-CoA dehydrogenase family protein [Salipiger sp.]|uniref:acyl-CoA dehydrogenase family protein n=1 Tax=Salipiger sp. TaxID=2078585 RepID=UPI003A97064D